LPDEGDHQHALSEASRMQSGSHCHVWRARALPRATA
jgi:hypothetical protein